MRTFFEDTFPVKTPTIRTVDDYVLRYAGWRGEIIQELRDIVQLAVPEVRESIRWLHPVYELNGPLCFIKGYRYDVRLGFWRGDQLPDPVGLLLPPNDSMRYVRLMEDEPIDHPYLQGLVKAAVKLHRKLGDQTSPDQRWNKKLL